MFWDPKPSAFFDNALGELVQQSLMVGDAFLLVGFVGEVVVTLRAFFGNHEGAQDVRRPPRSRRPGCFVEVCGSIAGGDKT